MKNEVTTGLRSWDNGGVPGRVVMLMVKCGQVRLQLGARAERAYVWIGQSE